MEKDLSVVVWMLVAWFLFLFLYLVATAVNGGQ